MASGYLPYVSAHGDLTRRAIRTSVVSQWIVSPRTGAGLRSARLSREEAADNAYLMPGGRPLAVPEPPVAQAGNHDLSVLRLFRPGMGRVRSHVHLDFAEHFIVLRGKARAELDGEPCELTAAAEDLRSTLYLPPGLPHVNPYNADSTDLVVAQTFEPATEGARSYIETLAEVLNDGRDHDGELPWEVVLAIGDLTDERTYFAPVGAGGSWDRGWSFTLQRKVALPIGRRLAALRRFHVQLPPGEDDG